MTPFIPDDIRMCVLTARACVCVCVRERIMCVCVCVRARARVCVCVLTGGSWGREEEQIYFMPASEMNEPDE